MGVSKNIMEQSLLICQLEKRIPIRSKNARKIIQLSFAIIHSQYLNQYFQ